MGQVICNDQGKEMGKIVRIHQYAPGKYDLFYVPIDTEIGFGRIDFYRSKTWERLEL